MGRVVDLARRANRIGGAIGAPAAAKRPAAVTAGAGRVALARGPHRDRSMPPAWGFGPPLEPFTFEGFAPWWDRAAAMSLPTISRCRDLIVSAVSALPLTFWRVDWSAVPPIEARTPPPSWSARPDPDRTRQWLLAWTVDDLMFYERAHWEITERFAASDGAWPAAFRRLPPGTLELNKAGTHATIDDDYGRRVVPVADIVEFLSPIEGLLSNGYRAISIALQLDAAAERFAACEIPAGVLEEQDGSEDLSAEELAELADTFAAARQLNTTAATNKYVKYRETPVDADALQLVEGRTYQALELSRLGNVPPYLAGAPAGTGMTYLNGQQSRQDLIDFGALPYIGCIEQTLSGPNVTPRNVSVRLDLNAWLRNPFTTEQQGEQSPNDMQLATDDQRPPGPEAVPA